METEELYQQHFDTYRPLFQEHFNNICHTITDLQKKNRLGPVSYLEYTLLYSSLIRRQETAQVRVYDENWYLDPNQQAVGSFDFSFLFVHYKELWTDLTAYRKRFAGMVTAQETTAFLLSCAPLFYKYIVSAFRFSILECVDTEPFLSIKRAAEFEINVGEYMANTECIYKENKNRTSEETLEWFSIRHEYKYAFEDFSGLDFSGADLSEIDLRYADLRRTNLAGTDFQDALLIGARFCNANMQNTDLRYSMLYEADFTGADLSNACFTAAEAFRGMPYSDEWLITGYRSVSFRHANLTNADFRRTKIEDADFTGAVMNGAMFLQDQLSSFALTREQKQAVRVLE